MAECPCTGGFPIDDDEGPRDHLRHFGVAETVHDDREITSEPPGVVEWGVVTLHGGPHDGESHYCPIDHQWVCNQCGAWYG